MEIDNQTWVREFILLGLSSDWYTQVSLFSLFLVTYLMTVLGNCLIVLLIGLDSRLHTPMYFFLTNLSLDVSYATSIVPQLAVHIFLQNTKHPLLELCSPVYSFFPGMGGAFEFVLAGSDCYDRYVAVWCDPPADTQPIIASEHCARLAIHIAGSVAPSTLLWQTAITFQRPCWLVWTPSSNEVTIMVSSIVLLMTPFCLVLLSYIQIISTILKIQSREGRKKAFHTCASHLTVVSLCYGTTIFTYIQPHSGPSVLKEKLISVFYAIVMPLLNPMIYSLRNKEVKGAWHKLLEKFSGITSKLAT
uniref:Olfactory receptor family 2 subfamily F member 2 n=1 Tax=Rhinopithecus bieti TaxID=61621 RepID=A0A2K6MB99_RHIBE